jgi:hypothetical protein
MGVKTVLIYLIGGQLVIPIIFAIQNIKQRNYY